MNAGSTAVISYGEDRQILPQDLGTRSIHVEPEVGGTGRGRGRRTRTGQQARRGTHIESPGGLVNASGRADPTVGFTAGIVGDQPASDLTHVPRRSPARTRRKGQQNQAQEASGSGREASDIAGSDSSGLRGRSVRRGGGLAGMTSRQAQQDRGAMPSGLLGGSRLEGGQVDATSPLRVTHGRQPASNGRRNQNGVASQGQVPASRGTQLAPLLYSPGGQESGQDTSQQTTRRRGRGGQGQGRGTGRGGLQNVQQRGPTEAGQPQDYQHGLGHPLSFPESLAGEGQGRSRQDAAREGQGRARQDAAREGQGRSRQNPGDGGLPPGGQHHPPQGPPQQQPPERQRGRGAVGRAPPPARPPDAVYQVEQRRRAHPPSQRHVDTADVHTYDFGGVAPRPQANFVLRGPGEEEHWSNDPSYGMRPGALYYPPPLHPSYRRDSARPHEGGPPRHQVGAVLHPPGPRHQPPRGNPRPHVQLIQGDWVYDTLPRAPPPTQPSIGEYEVDAGWTQQYWTEWTEADRSAALHPTPQRRQNNARNRQGQRLRGEAAAHAQTPGSVGNRPPWAGPDWDLTEDDAQGGGSDDEADCVICAGPLEVS
jgi:hypothetical protein